MATMDLDASRAWYTEVRPRYMGLADIVRGTIESLIRGARIDFLSVAARVKSVESFAEKMERKAYPDPKEMTDLAGIRVIAFVERDVDRACEIVRRSFRIHADKSLDKSAELGVDRFGYRSVHFVCDLGKDRVKLPEFTIYGDMLFEVQIRTVLQHAWAEIEHDRNYKFAGVLPPPLERRLYLIAGMLEIADREFNAISNELDIYAEEVSRKTKKGDLDVGLDSTSITEFLNTKFGSSEDLSLTLRGSPERVIDELQSFGVSTLSDLDRLLSSEFVDMLRKHNSQWNAIGLLRAAMMFSDPHRYFEEAWKRRWVGLTHGTYELLVGKYGEKKVYELIRTYGLK